MITYVDTSTLLKLVIEEDGSDRAASVWAAADAVASVSPIAVEARVALGVAQRAGRLTVIQRRSTVAELDELVASRHVIAVNDAVVSLAAELAEVEHLRRYDAVHLGAALTIGATVFSSADTAVCAAATRRGLHVANPLAT